MCKECLNLSPAYKNIKCYGSSHNSHEILTSWLINVETICFIKYIFIPLIYIFFNKQVGGVVELLLCFFLGGGLKFTPLKFGKLWFN